MDLGIILSPGMGHDQLEVIAAVGHERVYQELAFLFLEHLRSLLEEEQMGAGMPRKSPDIGLNQGNRGFCHVCILRSVLTY